MWPAGCVHAFRGNQSINHSIFKSLYPTQTETASSYHRPETLGKPLQATLKSPTLHSPICGADPASGDGATRKGYKQGKKDFTCSVSERSICFIFLL